MRFRSIPQVARSKIGRPGGLAAGHDDEYMRVSRRPEPQNTSFLEALSLATPRCEPPEFGQWKHFNNPEQPRQLPPTHWPDQIISICVMHISGHFCPAIGPIRQLLWPNRQELAGSGTLSTHLRKEKQPVQLFRPARPIFFPQDLQSQPLAASLRTSVAFLL